MELELGMTAQLCEKVIQAKTAQALGSGGLAVYATPAMIALMEGAALQCVQSALQQGETTVGTAINVIHESATPVDMEVMAVAKLIGMEGRKLTFEVEARDAKGRIGVGTHERFIVHADKFLKKVQSKSKE